MVLVWLMHGVCRVSEYPLWLYVLPYDTNSADVDRRDYEANDTRRKS